MNIAHAVDRDNMRCATAQHASRSAKRPCTKASGVGMSVPSQGSQVLSILTLRSICFLSRKAVDMDTANRHITTEKALHKGRKIGIAYEDESHESCLKPKSILKF